MPANKNQKHHNSKQKNPKHNKASNASQSASTKWTLPLPPPQLASLSQLKKGIRDTHRLLERHRRSLNDTQTNDSRQNDRKQYKSQPDQKQQPKQYTNSTVLLTMERRLHSLLMWMQSVLISDWERMNTASSYQSHTQSEGTEGEKEKTAMVSGRYKALRFIERKKATRHFLAAPSLENLVKVWYCVFFPRVCRYISLYPSANESEKEFKDGKKKESKKDKEAEDNNQKTAFRRQFILVVLKHFLQSQGVDISALNSSAPSMSKENAQTYLTCVAVNEQMHEAFIRCLLEHEIKDEEDEGNKKLKFSTELFHKLRHQMRPVCAQVSIDVDEVVKPFGEIENVIEMEAEMEEASGSSLENLGNETKRKNRSTGDEHNANKKHKGDKKLKTSKSMKANEDADDFFLA